MKNFKIYIFLTFLLGGDVSVSANSMLDLYFGGNNDSLRNEAFKLIHAPEPTFKPAVHMAEPDSATIADMELDDYVAGLKSVNKPMLELMGSEDEVFSSVATKGAILKNSTGEFQIIDKASHNGVRHNAQSFIFI